MKREYPQAPLIGVGGIVVEGGKVLLVKRGHEPQRGEWSLPGGALEVGETLVHGVEREVFEETGLAVEAVELVEVLDRIVRDPAEPDPGSRSPEPGRVRYHYVLIDYLCHTTGGLLRSATDVDDVCWATAEELRRPEVYGIRAFTLSVIEKALRMEESRRHAAAGNEAESEADRIQDA